MIISDNMLKYGKDDNQFEKYTFYYFIKFITTKQLFFAHKKFFY